MIYAYLVTDGNLFKIGRSSNPERRLADLASGNPSFELLGYSAELTENDLHFEFDARRVGGEWFCLEPYEVENILIRMNLAPGQSAPKPKKNKSEKFRFDSDSLSFLLNHCIK